MHNISKSVLCTRKKYVEEHRNGLLVKLFFTQKQISEILQIAILAMVKLSKNDAHPDFPKKNQWQKNPPQPQELGSCNSGGRAFSIQQ